MAEWNGNKQKKVNNDKQKKSQRQANLSLWTPHDINQPNNQLLSDLNSQTFPCPIQSPSRLPVFTGLGINTRKKHSIEQHEQDHQHKSHSSVTSPCLVHSLVPQEVRDQHAKHNCSLPLSGNGHQTSRSVPNSRYVSHRNSPVSSPSTPDGFRRDSGHGSGKNHDIHHNVASSSSTPQNRSRQCSISSDGALIQNNRCDNKKSSSQRVMSRPKFEQYMPLCEIQKGLKRGDIVEGVLRINPRNFEDAYISAPEGGLDIYVGGIPERNRALNGDAVYIQLKDESQWKILADQTTRQKTGKVVGIKEKIHKRIVGGHLRPMKDNSQKWALFAPRDSRMPRMMIPMSQCPADFHQHPTHYSQSLFIAKLEEWKENDNCPQGCIVRYIGDENDIEVESDLILIENGVNYDEFPSEVFIGLPEIADDEQWTIPDEEIKNRLDLRRECIFTIDPSTARDLDDALSVKPIDCDTFEVGVHIADVSFFVKEGMPLDEVARDRTTSVYLVQKVIPMLPRVLCEKLCSLTPGEDKLTFSVIWKMNSQGEILEHRFERTVINSCIKLSYELAQDMIDNPDKAWQEEELPQIFGEWNYRDISKAVNQLNSIGTILRKRRFDNGALKIDKLKLHFVLDAASGLPSGFSTYTYRQSNQLVEELMLLANIAVAHEIYKTFGDNGICFLRHHPSPDEKLFKDFKKFCNVNNFDIDLSTSLSLQKSLDEIVTVNPMISKVVALFLLKSMNQALYFVNGMKDSLPSYRHYALNVPLYTHFTSPIRRYPDIIVHRLLAASLSYREVIPDTMIVLHKLANKCNERKMNSRLISEASSKLFLHLYIKQIGHMEDTAVVVNVYDHSFDVMLLKSGLNSRIYMNQLPVKFDYVITHERAQLILTWLRNPKESGSARGDKKKMVQVIEACNILEVLVSVSKDDRNKLNVQLQHPDGYWPDMDRNFDGWTE